MRGWGQGWLARAAATAGPLARPVAVGSAARVCPCRLPSVQFLHRPYDVRGTHPKYTAPHGEAQVETVLETPRGLQEARRPVLGDGGAIKGTGWAWPTRTMRHNTHTIVFLA